MSVPVRLSSRRPDPVWAAAAVAAVGVFLAGWGLLHTELYADFELVDTPTYMRHGEAVLDGRVPYRDFDLEYPPGALPVFVVPALLADDAGGYRAWFETLMAACGAALVALLAVSLRALRADAVQAVTALGVAALAPIALGTVVLTRFDLWPALLVSASLFALLRGRSTAAFALLGAAIAAKLYAAVLVPVAAVYVGRRFGRQALGRAAVALGAVLAAFFVPALAVSPRGLADSLVDQLSRPLQLESLGSALLLAAHHLFGAGVTVETSHGSQNVVGTAPDVLAALMTVLLAAAVVALAIGFARGPAAPARLVRFAAASLVATVAFAKVLSPQFLLWLVAVVPLVRGRRGLAASALLAGALVLTQLWFPGRYWALALDLDGLASALLVARDVALVALLAVLVFPNR